MKYPTYRPDAICPKCGFPTSQMYRVLCKEFHEIIVEKEVKKCNIKGEHLHMECCCGNEIIFRPMDWGVKLKETDAMIAKKKGKKDE